MENIYDSFKSVKALSLDNPYGTYRDDIMNGGKNKILQIEIIKKPKNFSERLEFRIKTNLSTKENIQFSIMDSESIWSTKPDKDDTVLDFNTSLRLGNAKYMTQFTEKMQEKAFEDTEFSTAECYIKIFHPKVGTVYSEVFDVEEYDFQKSKKENWNPKVINELRKNADEGRHDKKRNCAMCCLNAFASNLRTLYKEKSPSNIPTNDIMSARVKSLDTRYYSKKIIIAPTYKKTRLTSKSHDINDSDEFLKNVKPRIEEKLLSLTAKNEISAFAVGIASEYHSTLVIVSKNKEFKIKFGSSELIGSNDDPLFLFVEDIGGCRSFRTGELDDKINEFLSGAYFYYSGKKKVGGAYYSHPEKDTSLDANVYQLFKPT